MSWWSYKPYVSVAQRRANASKEIAKLKKKGQTILPIQLEGRTIARTFWGKAWCENLESYSDYDNRLPRGRTYVRNGSVCDLQIEPGRVTALVCGSELYRIRIAIKPLSPTIWQQIRQQCAGQIGSVIELLQGKLSSSVMEIITRPETGLFPKPAEIELNCSCPDWAHLCKHVAAALYGVGARLDEHPELLFVLRQVDHLELIREAGRIGALTTGEHTHKTIADDALADVFGVEIAEINTPPAPEQCDVPPPAKTTSSSPARNKKKPPSRRKTASPVAASPMISAPLEVKPPRRLTSRTRKSRPKKKTRGS
ncbi:MAG TPA: SWIM zinc finger family protein [Tepidisphaeraceae bacterium]|nr:SWIM zinc finger family protein [Tepidisphaeraceae bacterium]